MTNVYPLEIMNVGDDDYILMSKGHHDVHEFMKQVRADGYDWPLGMPEHLWMRTVPSREDGVICRYVRTRKGERGAWPATYVHEAYGEHRYESFDRQRGNQPMTPSAELRIKAERIIRADRIANGCDVSHLDYERRLAEGMRHFLQFLTRINRALDSFSR